MQLLRLREINVVPKSSDYIIYHIIEIKSVSFSMVQTASEIICIFSSLSVLTPYPWPSSELNETVYYTKHLKKFLVRREFIF